MFPTTFEIRKVRCRGCGWPIVIPMRTEYSDPVYVAHVERENKMLVGEIANAHRVLLELAALGQLIGTTPNIFQR